MALTESHIALYIDGSCLENNNVTSETPAAWGLAIVTGDNGLGKGSGEIIHELWGFVKCNPADDEFLGAEVGSNNTAELTGFAMALRWLLIEGSERDAIIAATNDVGLMTRPVWKLLHTLVPYQDCPRAPLPVAESLEQRLINLPSSAGLA